MESKLKAMKIKHLLFSLAMTLSAFAVLAQEVENDDLYFNSKDRAKLKAKKATEVSYIASSRESNKEDKGTREKEIINPTDSYSARNVNPEFAARSNAEVAQDDNQDYFVTDYRYQTTNDLNNFNNNFNTWNNNPWYTSAWYGPSINRWNSPYYGYYDPYNSPWYDPYWNNNGWSASFSYHWGNSWNYGWGGNYNYYNRPYCGSGWASSWGMSYGWGPSYYGYGYGYGGYGYPGTVIIVNNGEGRSPNYGKRNSRSSNGGYVQNQGTSGRPSYSGSTSSGSRSNYYNSNGRVATPTPSGASPAPSRPSSDEYYNRSWRRVTQQQSTNTSSGSGTSNSSGRSSSGNSGGWYGTPPSNSGNSGVDRSNGGSRSTYTPSSSGSSGGSRSSGSSSSGSSSGGSSGGSRSRSRGN
jgi:hypothetical protein